MSEVKENEELVEIAVLAIDERRYVDAKNALLQIYRDHSATFLPGLALLRSFFLARPEFFTDLQEGISESELLFTLTSSTAIPLHDSSLRFCEDLCRKFKNSSTSNFLLGTILDVVLDKRPEAVEFYRNSKNDLGQCALAFCITTLGIPCDKEEENAESLLNLSCHDGNSQAESNLGFIFEGKGDKMQAEKLYANASGRGNPIAMCNLIELLLQEENQPRKEKAIKLLEHAANYNRSSRAMSMLGKIKEDMGDLENARKLYEKAVEQNNPRAQFFLGRMFYNSGDAREGMRLMCLSASAGFAPARQFVTKLRQIAKEQKQSQSK